MNREEIQENFLKQLGEDRQQLINAWENLNASPEWTESARAALIQSVHRLAGAALTVGYTRIGNAARLVENKLKQIAFPERDAVELLIKSLFLEIDRPISDDLADRQQGAYQTMKNVLSLQEARSSSLIYLVDDDSALAESLTTQLRYFGYSIQAFTNLVGLRSALKHDVPAAILMDIIFPEGEFAGIETVRALQEEFNNCLPVFFLSAREDISSRLQAIRTGGKHYFVKPVDIAALVDALDKIIVDETPEEFRVLIIDDSKVQAKMNAMHLKKAGINTRILSNPMDVLQALEEFLPDLLLLDLYMPECTGLELAQVIRQIKTFVSLPIVYLSAETDREKQLLAVGLGGDDFLTKPIEPDHLISAVTSRIERYRQLRALMLRDSLTGLYNHTSVSERLVQEVARTARHNQSLSLAMIDIDHFKKVNDTYGHSTGDRVLKALAHILTRRLRQSDIIGRYGGEEFVVIFPNTDQHTALEIMNELREVFSQVHHAANGDEFTVTFSCGVSTYPNRKTPAALSESADRALYEAKHRGRNQVVLEE